MMKYLIIIIVLLAITSPITATNRYLSNGGNDSPNTGLTTGSPWQTITKLNTVIASLTQGDTVFFERGSTFFGQMNTPGNGATGNPVVFAAYGTGAKPILTGLVSLTSWSNLGSNIWAASFNSGSYLDVVTLGNDFIMQGRSPNAGSYWNIDSHQNQTGGDFNNGYTGQTITSSSLTTNFVGGRAFIRKNEYNLDNDVITSYSGTTIGYATYNPNQISSNGNKFFVQNHLATVTAQNEWFYDVAASQIKMFSTTDPSSTGFTAAQYDFGMRINNRTGTNSHDYVFRNLVFKGYDSVGLCFTGTNNVRITNCEFYNIGGDAVSFSASNVTGNYSTIYGDYLCNNVTVDSCKIKWIGNTGIDHRFTSSGVYVLYNTIDSCGVYEGMGFPNNQQRDGIQNEQAGGSSGTVNNDSVIIYGNVVRSVGYCGIRWQGAKAHVSYNYVEKFGMQASDGGGIYTSRNAGDSITNYRQIHHNISVSAVGNRAMMNGAGTGGQPAYYQDDRTVNVNIHDNTFIEGTRYGMFLHNNRNVTAQNNNIFNNYDEGGWGSEFDGLEVGFSTRGLNISNNVIYSNGRKHLFLYSYTGSDVGSFGTINNNAYINTSPTNSWAANQNGSATNYSTLAAWVAAYGYDAGSTYQTVVHDSMQCFFNATLSPVTKTFTGLTYRDVSGTNYSDVMVLAPFESKIVKKVTYIAPPPSDATPIIYYRKKNTIHVKSP